MAPDQSGPRVGGGPTGRSGPRLATRGTSRTRTAVRTATALLVLLTVAGMTSAGWSAAIVRSDSMRPTLRAGDLLVLRPVPLADVGVGDVVTFADPRHPGRTLTHRVVASEATGEGVVTVQTRGDANSGSETWTADPDSDVQELAVRLPYLGRTLAWLGSGPVRALLVTVVTVALAWTALRWTWNGRP